MPILIIVIVKFSIFAWANSNSDIEQKILDSMCKIKGSLPTNSSCYDVRTTDDLPPLHENVTFVENSIFFLETSCNGGINLRQACSIESAAKLHPDREVVVFLLGPVTTLCLGQAPSWKILKYENIKFYRIYLEEYIRDTPVETLLKSEEMTKKTNPVVFLSEILRIVTLYKYGGTYLDLDVIVVKPLDFLTQNLNWIGKQDDIEIGTALLSLSKFGLGNQISSSILRLYQANNYQLSLQEIFTDIVLNVCEVKKIEFLTPKNCKGFSVYGFLNFYPVHSDFWLYYFGRYSGSMPTESFAFHMWNSKSHMEPIAENSRYAYLIREHCPVTNRISYRDYESFFPKIYL